MSFAIMGDFTITTNGKTARITKGSEMWIMINLKRGYHLSSGRKLPKHIEHKAITLIKKAA